MGLRRRASPTLGTLDHPVLEVVARTEDGRESTRRAFNDIQLERMTRQSVRFTVWIDDYLFNTFAGDGFVVSTGAGSTAYNLAAGGPAMHPLVQAMIVTPLNPHQAVPFKSVQFSIVVPLTSKVRFQAENLPKRGARLVTDGLPVLERVAGVEVRDSGRRITLLRSHERAFIPTLTKKLIGE